LQIFPIASSSDGNCTLVKTSTTSILIDCGISYKQLKSLLSKEQLKSLDAVFVTHEHSDHIKGLDMLGKRFNIPVYINKKSFTARAHQFSNIDNRSLEAESEIQIEDLTITPFEVQHDTVNTFGFNITKEKGKVFCFITDTGNITKQNKSRMAEADVLLIECNYDEEMLHKYPGYPNYLKTRIAEFHLSNQQALDKLEEIGVETFDMIIPAHLSPRTNNPQLLWAELSKRFPGMIDKFIMAPQTGPIRFRK